MVGELGSEPRDRDRAQGQRGAVRRADEDHPRGARALDVAVQADSPGALVAKSLTGDQVRGAADRQTVRAAAELDRPRLALGPLVLGGWRAGQRADVQQQAAIGPWPAVRD